MAIAQFYEVYNYFNQSIKLKISKKVLTENMIKIMKLMIPFTPHIAHELLKNLKCKNVNKWPIINRKVLEKVEINLVVQVNGKTRDVIAIKKDLSELKINKLIKESSKANKYLLDKKILKTIFVKNKIINYIIAN